MLVNNHGKGNRKAQRKRKNERRKNLPPRAAKKVMLIDGNFSYYPVAYCHKIKAYLTQGLVDTHNCSKCFRYESVVMPDESNS